MARKYEVSEWNLPRDLARQFYACSSRDNYRPILNDTINVKFDGDDCVIACTDTHRLLVGRMSKSDAEKYGIDTEGLFEFMAAPSGTQLMRPEMGDFPNYEKVIPTSDSIGRIQMSVDSYRPRLLLSFKGKSEMSLNPGYLPSLLVQWDGTVHNTSGSNMYKLTSEYTFKVMGKLSSRKIGLLYVLMGTVNRFDK